MAVVTSIFSDYETGWNRTAGMNAINARDDDTAIQCFLDRHNRRSSETFRNYSREIYRLKTWAAHVKQKAISDLNGADYDDYEQFLSDPPEHWRGNSVKVGPYQRKPFVGPLSESSRRHTFAVITSFIGFLVRTGYLRAMPLFPNTVMRRPTQDELRRQKIERQLTQPQMSLLLSYLKSKNDFDSIRARFFVYLVALTGLRIEEVALHKMNSFAYDSRLAEWYFKVVGKGNKYAEQPVPDQLLSELCIYRNALGLPSLPGITEETPLLGRRDGKALTSRRIQMLLKDALFEASKLLPPGPDRETMRECSAHWFRHMYVSTAANSGLERRHVMAVSRHESEKMVNLYDDSMRAQRFAALKNIVVES